QLSPSMWMVYGWLVLLVKRKSGMSRGAWRQGLILPASDCPPMGSHESADHRLDAAAPLRAAEQGAMSRAFHELGAPQRIRETCDEFVSSLCLAEIGRASCRERDER